MHIGKRLFPYPILNNNKEYSQYLNGEFSLIYEDYVSSDSQTYILKGIHAKLESSFLNYLVDNDKASIIVVIESSSTMYRKVFPISTTPKDVELPLSNLSGKVEISSFIIANEDIKNYSSKEFIDDYADYNFEIEKNDILAVDDGYNSRIDFDSDEDDDKKSSIFLVVKDKKIKDGSVKVEYDTNHITISMQEDEWNEYDKTKRIKKFQNIYFSILAIPSLSYCLNILKRIGDDIDVLRIDYKWFNSFLSACEKKYNRSFTNEEFLNMNSYELAQNIFDCPVSSSIDDVFKLTIGVGGVDDGD